MDALIERLEVASEGSATLDKDIHFALGGRSSELRSNYTRSIDVALTLVPEGCAWTLLGGKRVAVTAVIWKGGEFGLERVVGKSETVALALCIAALKARTSTGKE